jgi:hypothetical protein
MADYKDKDKDKAQGSIEEVLLRELRFGGIDKDNLKELVGIVAGIQRSGLKRMKAFPLGISPPFEGIRVSGLLEVSEVSKFLGDFLPRASRLSEVYFFPYGIPWPEIFRVDINLGAPGKRQTDQF